MTFFPRAAKAGTLLLARTTAAETPTTATAALSKRSLAALLVATGAASARAFSTAVVRRPGLPSVLAPSGCRRRTVRKNGGSFPSVLAGTRGGGAGASSSPGSQRHASTMTEAEGSAAIGDAPAARSSASAAEKLAALREKMAECGVEGASPSVVSLVLSPPPPHSLSFSLDAAPPKVYLVPSDDPHLSEYVPAAYMRRGYLTDFHGSAGTAVVTRDKAYLWTDSR